MVAKAREVVPHIQAHEDAPEGKVTELSNENFLKQTFHPTKDAILCRNTKPLVKMAYALIKKGVACHVEGRDIGLGLIKLVNRFNTNDLLELDSRLADYRDHEVEKLIAKGKETAAEALSDRVETVQVMMEDKTLRTVIDLQNRISGLFLDGEKEAKKTLCLSTCHRSKGLEWDRVFLYGKDAYMPSKYARQEWQIRGEMCLIYVAYTRAKSELVLVQASE